MSDDELTEPEKDPSASEGNDGPMTAEQRSQIESLSGDEDLNGRELSQAEAAQLIDQLGHRTGQESD